MRLWWLMLLIGACKKEVPAPPDSPGPIEPAPYTQPRLMSVGSVGTVDYNADGYPTAIGALYRHVDLVWDGGTLVSATAVFTPTDFQHTVMASFTFDAGRLVAVQASCTGGCMAATRSDTLAYNATGALTDWVTVGANADTRHYEYDDRDRLTSVTTSSGVDTLSYALGDGCLTKDSVFPTSFRYRDGHITSFGGDAIAYDDAGRILHFDSTGPPFHDLLYSDGEAHGIDLWPGLYNGGFAYGFPVRGELFRLDGTCDPTLRSQLAILGLVVSSL